MARKKPRRIQDVNIDYIVNISKLIETKNNYKYLIGYLDDAIGPLVLMLPEMGKYIRSFRDKDKNKNNKLMSFFIKDEKLYEKYKIIQTKTEDLQNTELNSLPIFDDRYIKTKIRTLYSFMRKKYYLQVYLDN